MIKIASSRWRGYGLAVLAIVFSLLLPFAFLWLGLRFNFSWLFIAILLYVAWHGGRGPGLFVAIVFSLIGNYLSPPAPGLKLTFSELNRLGILVLLVVLTSARRRAENSLREERERLRVTLASIGDGVIATDTRGSVTFINDTASSLTGWTAGDAIGRQLGEIFNIVDEDTRKSAENPVETVLRKGEVFNLGGRTLLITRDGSERAIRSAASPIRASNKKVIGIVLVFHDVTERRRSDRERAELLALEQRAREEAQKANRSLLAEIAEHKKTEEALAAQRAFLRQLIDLNPTFIFAKDRSGRFTLVNQTAAQAYGVSVEAMIGKTHFDFNSDYEQAKRFQEDDLEVIESGREKMILEEPLTTATGETRWLQTIKRPILSEDGRTEYLLGVATDITEQRQAKERLQEYAARLEQSNRELQDFAYVASHDLQEPLRKIRAFGDRLKAKYMERLDEQGVDYLTRMQQAAERMQTLISDLLSFSRVTTKAQPFVPVDLEHIARGVVSDLEARIEQTGGRVEIGSLPKINADPTQMRQLLQNLIGNALKFHREGEPPVVKIQAEVVNSSAPPHCRLVVEDNGIGFDEKYLDRIFTPFQRLHGRNVYEGTGIGLAICRKIVERHQGTITASSRPEEGAAFIITLPVKRRNDEQ